MRNVSSDGVREAFLEFFQDNDHLRIGSSRLVPDNDPTLLFVNSGMAPLKPYFTGAQSPPSSRLCNVQPVLRTTDIEDVGDRHHLTFFEMLGSWSIGDYFKDRAIELAFELLTDKLQIPAAKLFVSVFAGDEMLGLPPDEESARAWERVGIPPERIVRLGREDNFWGPAGQTGPCGPCTEVFIDTGDDYGPAYIEGGVFDTTRRYIEIWNAGVFMQLDKQADGRYRELPFYSVDTGSGLERLTLALTDVESVYETDLLRPIVEVARQVLDDPVTVSAKQRLLADHMRAVVFLLAEGVLPSNEGRGYIPRRLIRRSLALTQRSGVTVDLVPMVEAVITRSEQYYPRLGRSMENIRETVKRESQDFVTVMGKGIERLQELTSNGESLSGDSAFRLFSTYGLPIEITRELAAARGSTVDIEGFRVRSEEHRHVSRADRPSPGRFGASSALPDGVLGPGAAHFVGHEHLVMKTSLVAAIKDGRAVESLQKGDSVDLLFRQTPFYAEGGGQVGDVGIIEVDGAAVARVQSTVRHPSGYHIHRGVVQQEWSAEPGSAATLTVDEAVRRRTAANHSATHLLNAALRKVLGSGVRQAGSLVEPDRLRFDFTYSRALTPQEITKVELLVNQVLLEDHQPRTETMTVEAAKGKGAIALAGETYGEAVRVVSIGNFSKELCGGTHVSHASQIGSFKLVGQQSVASGVRRLVAVTQFRAVEHVAHTEAMLRDASALLRVPFNEVPQHVRRLLERDKTSTLQDAVDPLTLPVVRASNEEVVASELPLDPKELRSLAIATAESRNLLTVLWSFEKTALRVVVAVPEASQSRLDATAVLRSLLRSVGGAGGGGRAIAQGGASGVGHWEPHLERALELDDGES